MTTKSAVFGSVNHYFLELFQVRAKIACSDQKGVTMLAGVLVAAIIGGIAGLAVSLLQDLGGVQMLLAYQLGGMTAVLVFLSVARVSLQPDVRHS